VELLAVSFQIGIN